MMRGWEHAAVDRPVWKRCNQRWRPRENSCTGHENYPWHYVGRIHHFGTDLSRFKRPTLVFLQIPAPTKWPREMGAHFFLHGR